MERTKRNTPDVREEEKKGLSAPDPHEGEIKWNKKGGGTFRMASGRIVKGNSVFWARPDEIPKSFRDIIVPLTPITTELVEEPVDAGYSIQPRSPGWYDVVDGNGKVLNERALRLDKAGELLEGLKGETEK